WSRCAPTAPHSGGTRHGCGSSAPAFTTRWWRPSGLSAEPPTAGAGDDGVVLADIDPATVRRVHLVGVAGSGMAAFAGMLKAAGYQVTGSDQNVYPPMSDLLAAEGIPVLTPYDPANLDTAKPELVIIGNVVRHVNPEATAARQRRLAQMSFPAA